MSRFLALDFETANRSRTSACALGLVAVSEDTIVAAETFLIRPPRSHFEFTPIHGLTWEHVQNAPTFAELWPQISPYIEQADFLLAHNASFDQGVLGRCCEHYGLPMPQRPFICTVQLARRKWGIYPTRLPDVCARLGIALSHHDAGSDARACAEIALRARREGWRPVLPSRAAGG
ncbi:MAG: 3'-5' exonuclease [Gammaproteobacteria bacterium]|nr:3'-5' exonuclease [Gammaproteobacteria bacterium]